MSSVFHSPVSSTFHSFVCTFQSGILSFTVKDSIPDWKVQTNEWNVADTGKWKTEDTDNFFYEIEEKK